MDAQVKELWIESLLDGNHVQGRGHLRYEEDGQIKECCLGVLCELAVLAGVIPPGELSGDGYCYSYGSGEFRIRDGMEYRETLVLPLPVKSWAGLDHTNPAVGEDRECLATYNDGREGATEDQRIEQHSFEQIAELIEANL